MSSFHLPPVALLGVRVASLAMERLVPIQFFSTHFSLEQKGQGSDKGLSLFAIVRKVSHVFLHLLQENSYDGIIYLFTIFL